MEDITVLLRGVKKEDNYEKMEENMELYREVAEKKIENAKLMEINKIIKSMGEELFRKREEGGKELFEILDMAIEKKDSEIAESVLKVLGENYTGDIFKLTESLRRRS